MNIIGIVAEYNPFHTGHGYQIAQSRQMLPGESAVVAVMSGNWVQQADCAIADKWTRARLALLGGADLVLELPTVFATASAERFGAGAVELLASTGVVTHLSFGSECGDVDKLWNVASCLNSPEYHAALQGKLSSGLPFARCRQEAAEDLLGSELADLLSTPNNNLGVEYCKALQSLGSAIIPITVTRRGAAHNSLSEGRPPFLSATQIRQDLYAGDWTLPRDYIVPGGAEILEQVGDFPSLDRVERAILSKLRTMTARDWGKLPDSGTSEGLPQRLEKAGRQCASVEEFLDLSKTKRYTYARLRRLLLWAWLGLTAEDFAPHPAYLRVLGFNSRGQQVLKEMKDTAALPILTKPAHARKLPPEALAQFEVEGRCTDLYDLCFTDIPRPGREWNTDPVRMEG